MNAEQLQVIKERVKKATKGPWIAVETRRGSWAIDSKSETLFNYIALEIYKDNAQFIAHAYEDILTLIAEVEQLQNIIISERRESLIKTYESIGAEDAEIIKLRKALEFYADEKNYNRITLSILTAKVLLDNGKLARKALEGTK